MITKTVTLNNPESHVLKAAAGVLTSGGIVVHPTDTAYGLAANIFDTAAINRIYDIKGRDYSKGLIVCVLDLAMADNLVYLNDMAAKLLSAFTPGPLTVVLPKKDTIPPLVSGNLPTLAIRIPNCAVTKALSKLTNLPYSTTSANPSGKTNPYSSSDIISEFPEDKLNLIDLFLDAGHLPEVKPSTIVDLTTTDPKILRVGPISEAEIFACLKL